MEKQNVVGWFEIYVDDMVRAKSFYAKVFQYGDFTDLSDAQLKMFAFPSVMDAAYTTGALVKAKGMSPGKGGTVVYFHSIDCAVEEARVAENGGKVLRPKMSIGEYGFVSIVEDTEGNLIGVHSRR